MAAYLGGTDGKGEVKTGESANYSKTVQDALRDLNLDVPEALKAYGRQNAVNRIQGVLKSIDGLEGIEVDNSREFSEKLLGKLESQNLPAKPAGAPTKGPNIS